MKKKNDNSIRDAFFLNVAFTILELIGGILSGSIAILADSLHDFADSLSLGAGWYLENKSKKSSTEKYSYGYARFSLLGAMINAITLLLGSIYIIYESVNRIIDPEMPNVYWMLGTSVIGIALNGIAVWRLKSGKNMNRQVMLIHLLEDALGWVEVFIGSIVLLFIEIPILDPLLAIIINILVLAFVMTKLVASIQILLQKVPDNVNIPELRQKILCLNNVKDVSHLHVWSLNEEKIVATVHIRTVELHTVDEEIKLKKSIETIFNTLNPEHLTIDFVHE